MPHLPPEFTEPLMEDDWSEIKTISFGTHKDPTYCYQERLTETFYGPELEVTFWIDGQKETTTQHSQEAAAATTQISWHLDDEEEEEPEYPDNCGLEL